MDSERKDVGSSPLTHKVFWPVADEYKERPWESRGLPFIPVLNEDKSSWKGDRPYFLP
jgi:hypothetical protein